MIKGFFIILIIFILLNLLVLLRILKIKKDAQNINPALADLKLLHKVGKKISSKLKMKELLPEIMAAFAQAGNVKKGSLMILDDETDKLRIEASLGISERAAQNIELSLGEGIAGKVAETGKSILINDTFTDNSYKEFFTDEKNKPKETMLSLPLKFGDKILGVINLDSKISGEKFIRNDERLLSILAGEASIAINNALMYQMAITDSLTKLYIQRYFYMRIKEEFSKAERYKRPLALIFIDIDNFKLFNDTHGHKVGNMALLHIADMIRTHTRTSDVSCRYGGDEFVIILPETAIKRAIILAERLRNNIQNSLFQAESDRYLMTVSIGIAEYESGMKDHEDLIKLSDDNLYRAKKAGRNSVES